MKVVSTKLSNTEWQNLIDKCNSSGCTIAEYIRELLLKDISNNNAKELKETLRQISEKNKVKKAVVRFG